MRPVRLVMKAFGPFAGTEEIDFLRFDKTPIFLLHGPTGAGKTTIFDAICYALFGKTSGGSRNGTDMRSHYADPDTQTEVTFDFLLGSKAYRVNRKPTQLVPKVRGEGERTIQPQATFWDRSAASDASDEGTVLETRERRVTEEVERLLGFQADQFRQVVMLPQGEFRKFLEANGADRSALLEVLFQTEHYTHIMNRLKEEEKSACAELKAFETARKLILEMAHAAGEDEIKAKIKEYAKTLEELEKQIAEAEESEQAQQKKIEEAREIQRKQKALRDALENLQALLARCKTMDAKKKRLSSATKAAEIVSLEQNHQERSKELKAAMDAFDLAEETLRHAEARLQKGAEVFQKERQKEPQQNVIRQKMETLTAMLKDAEQLQQEADALATLDKQVTEHAQKQKDLQTSLEQLSKQAEECAQKREEAKAEASRLPMLKTQKATAELRKQKGAELAKLTQELSKALKECEKLRKGLEAEEAQYGRVRQEADEIEFRWHRGQAFILAKTLALDAPCPVCGSKEHPAPAETTEDLPSEAAVKTARDKVREHEKKREEARKKLGAQEDQKKSLELTIQSVRNELGDQADDSLDSFDERLSKAEAELKSAEKAGKQEIDLGKKLDGIRTKDEECRTALSTVEKEFSQSQQEQSRKKGTVEILGQKVPEQYRGIGALPKILKEQETELASLKKAFEDAQSEYNDAKNYKGICAAQLQSADQAKSEKGEHAHAAKIRFDEGISNSRFKDEKEYLAAKLERSEMQAMGEELHAFEVDLQVAKETAAKIRLAVGQSAEGDDALLAKEIEKTRNILKKCQADLGQMDEEKQDAHRTLEKRKEQKNTIKNKRKEQKDCLERLKKNNRESQEKEARYQILKDLTDVATGGKGKINFQRYVLGSLFDDVLNEASRRLEIMSNGRYQILRPQGEGELGTGLELAVLDAHTGRQRPANTLSGGESFLASLSLSLGLSDFVQRYAGGIKLETIFIDEGFGSLDPEALDLAIRALIELQSGNRLVGIVSHVSELRERITSQLQVIAERNGSRTRITTG